MLIRYTRVDVGLQGASPAWLQATNLGSASSHHPRLRSRLHSRVVGAGEWAKNHRDESVALVAKGPGAGGGAGGKGEANSAVQQLRGGAGQNWARTLDRL